MTCREAIFTLHTLFRLSGRRAEQQTANKAAKYLYCLLAVFVCGYMAWAGLKLAELVSAGHLGSYRFIFGLLPFLLFFDYVLRYASDSRRPVQVRPYLLLPLPKYACTDCLIIRQLLHVKNTFFLFLCIPFGIMTVVPEQGVKAMAGYTLGLYLLLLANGQFFQFTQVLIAQRLRYWLLPAVVYLSAAATPFFFSSPQNYISLFARAGDALMTGNVCVYTVLLLLLAVLTGLNRRVLYDWTRQEQYAAASSWRYGPSSVTDGFVTCSFPTRPSSPFMHWACSSASNCLQKRAMHSFFTVLSSMASLFSRESCALRAITLSACSCSGTVSSPCCWQSIISILYCCCCRYCCCCLPFSSAG